MDQIQEIYLIVEGKDRVQIGSFEPSDVGKGDVIVFPPGVHQSITNDGKCDLVFYCICTPAFSENYYHDDGEK